MATIFLTGATGYIGGDLPHLLAQSHPEYTVRTLNRDPAKGEAIQKAFNGVQLVDGTLDDADLISQEAENADVVLHLAANKHLNSVEAIHRGLQAKSKSNKTPFCVQVSGASGLAAAEIADKSRTPGTPSYAAYNDLEGIDSIWSLIKQHPFREVDNYILSVATDTPAIKTALILPPIIYGQGRGPVNQRSVQIPGLAKATLERRRGLQVSPGLSQWGNIHIQDLSQLLLRLVENAVEGNEDSNVWGQNGLYLTSSGELSLGEISKSIAAAAFRI
ncbi:hypothetical protein GGR58DRAFT_451157 [Xylaria digitata]|nr:hypothetical protein GGR58DRAFT_451157 [Xylaria digitata]